MTHHDQFADADAALDFSSVYRRHHTQCLRVALAVTRDHHHAEDAVQEAFLGFARDPDRFDHTKAQLGTWLAVLTHRRAVDIVRREQSRPRPTPTADVITTHLEASPDPEEQAHRALVSDKVRDLVANLDDSKRRIIVMSYYLGYSQTEISAATGIPLGTIKTRTRNALQQLRATAA